MLERLPSAPAVYHKATLPSAIELTRHSAGALLFSSHNVDALYECRIKVPSSTSGSDFPLKAKRYSAERPIPIKILLAVGERGAGVVRASLTQAGNASVKHRRLVQLTVVGFTRYRTVARLVGVSVVGIDWPQILWTCGHPI